MAWSYFLKKAPVRLEPYWWCHVQFRRIIDFARHQHDTDGTPPPITPVLLSCISGISVDEWRAIFCTHYQPYHIVFNNSEITHLFVKQRVRRCISLWLKASNGGTFVVIIRTCSNRETWCITKIGQGLVQRIYWSPWTMILFNCLYQILGNGASFIGLGKTEEASIFVFFASIIRIILIRWARCSWISHFAFAEVIAELNFLFVASVRNYCMNYAPTPPIWNSDMFLFAFLDLTRHAQRSVAILSRCAKTHLPTKRHKHWIYFFSNNLWTKSKGICTIRELSK